jgi:hypothetical protein
MSANLTQLRQVWRELAERLLRHLVLGRALSSGRRQPGRPAGEAGRHHRAPHPPRAASPRLRPRPHRMGARHRPTERPKP